MSAWFSTPFSATGLGDPHGLREGQGPTQFCRPPKDGEPALRILLVEDDEVDRIAIRRTLGSPGGRVRIQEATCAGEMRAALASAEFDCVLLDQRLPDADGLDLISEIVATNPRTAIVVLTGMDDEACALRALSQGVDDYLVKSRVDHYTLLRSVRYATERRRVDVLRAQLQHMDRLAAIGGLASGVAHELANAINCIAANLIAIFEEPQRASSSVVPLGALVEDTLAAAAQMTGMVRELLMLAHSDERPKARLSVEKVLDRAVNIAAVQVRARAHLVKAYGDAPPVRATAQRLMQVFINLLITAVEAIPFGVVAEHEVRVSTTRDTSGRAIVEISGSGIGIPAASAGARLSELFSATTSVSEGSGLALSMCRSIVASLGGEITCSPRSGGGTVFRVALPPDSQGEDPVAEAILTPALVPRATRLRVLIVDDEFLLLRTWSAAFGDMFELTTCRDPLEALTLIASGRRFDVIVSDLVMPTMSGSTFYDSLAALAPDQAARTLILTGGATSSEAATFLDRMAGRYLRKPITGAMLSEHIQRVAREQQGD